MASPSSSGGDQKYDVFLSFRGEDTRKTFVCHLYDALIQKMNAYQDSKDLEKGNEILKLLEVIEDSRISIVVLSQNYASSKWCLRELAKIMDCRDNKKQIVAPIFYYVDPSDLRYIKGTFAQAFAKHRENSQLAKKELESWRLALTRVADLSGWNWRDYKDDTELIKNVVGDTSKWIDTSSYKANKDLVGMDSHITEMNAKLCLQVNDVRGVGIWGMGGLGKTTIARAVYGEIAFKFEHYCFAENVKEAFEKKGEVEMQRGIISELLNNEVRNGGLDRGRNEMKGKLRRKRVLVVLDDVETSTQIKELLGELHAFGKGSRIIVTSRDKESLMKHETYLPKCLDIDKSRELFMKHAFREDQYIEEEHDNLINQAIGYAQGLPLALKVLGASLYDKDIHEWKDMLEKIKIIPHRKIMDVLRISFKGLDYLEQELFLDIACFFKGWEQDFVKEVLHNFYPHIGLKILVNRALLMISENGVLDMHDLLREMGREIVRGGYLEVPVKEPEQRSRLWSFEDVDQVLTENTTTAAIECLMLDLRNKDDAYCLNVGAFVKMTKLRVLIINDNGWNPSFKRFTRGELDSLSNKLRLLYWIGCPLKSLPNTFTPKNLVILDMSGSHIQQLWEGTMPLPNLKEIRLSHCKFLVKIPDLTEAIHLKKLYLNGCSSFEMFPEISGTMKNLSELCLDGTAVKGLPSSIHLLEGLKKITMRNCKSLECLPDSICNLALLTHLVLEGCNRLKSIPELSSINRIDAHCCTALETVSTPKIDCTDLDFRFSNCRRLVQTNLFTNIVETHFRDQDLHPRPLSCYMCFPASEIPSWFSHQSRASSITVQLPPNWFDEMFLGFAICAVSCFNEMDHNFSPHVVARCYCTFKGNQGEHKFSFHLQDWNFTIDRSLESDHMFMAYVSWSKFSLAEKSEPVNERYYTEATFKIVVESKCNTRSERHCMTKYGVRFFHGSYDVHNESMTHPTDHVELGAPSFQDQLAIRKSVTERETESIETAAERGTCQILELLPEPQTERNEEVMVAAAQVDGPRVLGSVCSCMSLSGCTMCLNSEMQRNRKRRRQSHQNL